MRSFTRVRNLPRQLGGQIKSLVNKIRSLVNSAPVTAPTNETKAISAPITTPSLSNVEAGCAAPIDPLANQGSATTILTIDSDIQRQSENAEGQQGCKRSHPDHRAEPDQRWPATLLDPLPTSPCSKSFPKFAILPPELRLLVWYFASLFEQVAEVRWTNVAQFFKFKLFFLPPAILRSCHESRKVALGVYKPYFRGIQYPRTRYFNPKCDILIFRSMDKLVLWRKMVGSAASWRLMMRYVRRIAFLYSQTNSRLGIDWIMDTLPAFENLEELIIFWEDDSHPRPLDRRGVSSMEQFSEQTPNVDIDGLQYQTKQSAIAWRDRIQNYLDVDEWGERRGLKKPEVTVKYWFLRG